MNLTDILLPENNKIRERSAIIISVVFAIILTLIGIYWINEYGVALFLITPFFMGLSPTILFGYKKSITYRRAYLLGFYTLFFFSLGLLVFAIEGIICIIMAAPIAILFNWLGSTLGYYLINKKPKTSSKILLLVTLSIPLTSFIEKQTTVKTSTVITAIDINAPIELVWENVVAFPELDAPTEFIFKTGISYPISSKIEGEGIGAIRYCNFTTGSFVEPITCWDKPNLLAFDVLEQPEPMKEISFWDIDAPHLHDYFVSTNGQFKLTELNNGLTRLEGTTTYYHKIKPAIYWQSWSDYIIHKIHERVLKHIKSTAEKQAN